METQHKVGHKQIMTPNVLSINKSTVIRESQRNRDLRDYRPKQDHVKAMQKQNETPKAHIPLITWVMVDALIKQD